MVEAPATLFARGDKYEQQLATAGQAANPSLRLALMLASGEYDAAVCEWKARDPAHKTFARFRAFIQKEFALRHKNNKSTAGLVGHGAAAYAIQEVANAMQQKQDKQFEQVMEMFKTMMQAQGNNTSGSNVPDPAKVQTPKCKHCKRRHRKAEADCWELEANKDK
jgi:hypothetical protein